MKYLIFKVPFENYSKWFKEISVLMFILYFIKTKNCNYRITEIEFYYYSKNHKDETTYGFAKNMNKLPERIQRLKKAQCDPLTWFFHYSGIDLVIGKEDEPGGILIRGIENIRTKEKLRGPLVVLLELLNQQIDIGGNKALQIEVVPNNNEFQFELVVSKRVGLGIGNFEDALYSFSTK